MKKNNNRKGFTIVELVIVIAVIAILAAVLMPTFSGVIDKANESAALQEAKNAYTNLLVADADANISVADEDDAYIKSGNYWFVVNEGELTKMLSAPDNGLCVDTTPAKGDAVQEVYVKSSVAVKDGAAYVYTKVPANG